MTTRPHGAPRGFRHLDRRGTLLLVCPARRARDRARGGSLRSPRSIRSWNRWSSTSTWSARSRHVPCSSRWSPRRTRFVMVARRRSCSRSGCVAVGFMMLGHGLTTPGIFGRPMNMWVARLPVLALATFAGCLAAAARPDGVVSRFVARSPRVALVFPAVIDRPRVHGHRDRADGALGFGPRAGRGRDQDGAARRERHHAAGGRWGSLAALAAGEEPHRAGVGPGELADHVRAALARLRDVLEALVVGLPPLPARGVRGGGLGGRRRVPRLTHPGGRGRRHDGARSAGAGRPRPARRAPRADRRRRGEGPVHARTFRPRGRAVHEDRAAPGAGTGCGPWSASGRVPARRGEDQRPGPGLEQAGRAGPG